MNVRYMIMSSEKHIADKTFQITSRYYIMRMLCCPTITSQSQTASDSDHIAVLHPQWRSFPHVWMWAMYENARIWGLHPWRWCPCPNCLFLISNFTTTYRRECHQIETSYRQTKSRIFVNDRGVPYVLAEFGQVRPTNFIIIITIRETFVVRLLLSKLRT